MSLFVAKALCFHREHISLSANPKFTRDTPIGLSDINIAHEDSMSLVKS